MTTATIYVVYIASFLSQDIRTGVIIGGVFGLARGASLAPARLIKSVDDLGRLNRWLDDWARVASAITIGSLVIVGAAATAAML